MRWLEHRIPPPIVALLLGAAMWSFARIGRPLSTPSDIRLGIAVIFVLTGLVATLLGSVAFRRAETTVNPLKPEAVSSLVVVGIYRYTRNPMYLGIAMVLIGWACYLASVAALLGPIVFVLFITRFQIIPEERVLNAKFGAAFTDYQQRVRRWL